MDIQVSHSVTIRYYDQSSITLHTYFYGGHWMWFGALSNVVGHDELGCKIFEMAGKVDCGSMFFDNSEDAIVHAVAQFDGTEDDGPEDDYPGDVLPTGWDAQDHKALYE